MQPTQSHIIITTTCNTQASCEAITRALLEGKLAACVQVSQVESHYWWQGKITHSAEFLLTIKTQKELADQVEVTIRQHHDYEVPEILQIAVEAGSGPYIHWISEVTKQ